MDVNTITIMSGGPGAQDCICHSFSSFGI